MIIFTYFFFKKHIIMLHQKIYL